MSRPDEGLIHAWLDGELSPEESARVDALVARDAEWRAAVAEARGLIAASSRIVAALDAVPSGVTPRTGVSPRRSRRARALRPWVAVAAGAVFVAGTQYAVRERTNTAFDPATASRTAAAPQEEADSPAPPPAESPRATDLRSMQGAPSGTASPQPAERDAAAASGAGVASLGDLAKGAPTEVAPAVRESALVQPSLPAASPPPAPSMRTPEVAAPQALNAAPAREEVDAERRSLARDRASREARVATPRTDAAPAAAMGKAESLTLLSGCWLVTEPDSLRGRVRDPAIHSAVGDTLLIEISAGRLARVVRAGDRLTGELTATRELCPPPE